MRFKILLSIISLALFSLFTSCKQRESYAAECSLLIESDRSEIRINGYNAMPLSSFRQQPYELLLDDSGTIVSHIRKKINGSSHTVGISVLSSTDYNTLFKITELLRKVNIDSVKIYIDSIHRIDLSLQRKQKSRNHIPHIYIGKEEMTFGMAKAFPYRLYHLYDNGKGSRDLVHTKPSDYNILNATYTNVPLDREGNRYSPEALQASIYKLCAETSTETYKSKKGVSSPIGVWFDTINNGYIMGTRGISTEDTLPVDSTYRCFRYDNSQFTVKECQQQSPEQFEKREIDLYTLCASSLFELESRLKKEAIDTKRLIKLTAHDRVSAELVITITEQILQRTEFAIEWHATNYPLRK